MTGESTPGPVAASRGGRASWPLVFLLVSLGAAFADASIVVLALPDMYADFFGATPFSLALLLVAYNLFVAVVAFAVHPYLGQRLDARRTALVGLTVFFASCMACAGAQSIEVLTVFRFSQGLGAGLLIVASLELLREMATDPRLGASLWGGAGFLGAALGPAVGGALTELSSWRGMFVGLGILALPGLIALLSFRPDPVPVGNPRGYVGRWFAATEVVLYAALVCALFLTITMLVEIWRLSPLEAAGVLTTLPAAAALGWPVARLAGRTTCSVAGFVLLSLGLFVLAFIRRSASGSRLSLSDCAGSGWAWSSRS